MTSKNLFFKLMKKDLGQRLWAVALIGMGCFFAYPVTAAVSAGDIERYEDLKLGMIRYSDQILEWLSFENGMTAFVMMVAALVCGISGFAWLNAKSKVDFYHSIPVRREVLFAVDFINGILIMAVPYVISMAAAGCIAVGYGVDGTKLWPVIFAACGLHLTYFILMYTMVVVSVMLTGNMVVAFLGCVVFSSVVPLAVSLIQGYFMMFFRTGMWESWQNLMETGIRFSPVCEYINSMEAYINGERMAPYVMAALAASALFTAVGCFLYKKRPSEAAGKAMAFSVTMPVIRIILVLLSAFGLGAFFWGLRSSTGWAVFGIICGAVISHCTIEIIYHFDFKRLFEHPVQLAGCVLVSVAVLFAFRYDWFGYDTYIPDAGKVRCAAVSVDRLDSWVSRGYVLKKEDGSYQWKYLEDDWLLDMMESEDVETICNIAAAGVEQLQEKKQDTVVYEEDGSFSRVKICYTMKNGRKVYRSYHMDLDRNLPLFEKLYASEAYKKASFPLMKKTADEVADIRWRCGGEASEVRLDALGKEEKKELLETYQKEFSEMTIEQLKYELPAGLIRFTSDMDVAALNWEHFQKTQDSEDYYPYLSYNFAEKDYYPVYRSFKETCSLLRKHGIIPGDFYDRLDLYAITVSRWNEKKEVQEQAVFEEPEEIEKLKKVISVPGIQYYNSMYLQSDLDVVFYNRDGRQYENYAVFPKDQVPDFVLEKLQPVY